MSPFDICLLGHLYTLQPLNMIELASHGALLPLSQIFTIAIHVVPQSHTQHRDRYKLLSAIFTFDVIKQSQITRCD